MGLDVWVVIFEVFLDFGDFLLWGETVQDNIEVSFGQCICNSQSDATEGSGDDGYFVGWSKNIERVILCDEGLFDVV